MSTFAGTGKAGFKDGDSNVAQFYSPYGITIDQEGILYVADYSNHRIRKITPTGIIFLALSSYVRIL